MSPQVSSPPIQFQNAGTPLGISFTFNCTGSLTCSLSNGVLTASASGGSGTINSCATTNALTYYSASTTLSCDGSITTNASGALTATTLLASNGSSGTPSIAFSAQPGLGFFRRGTDAVDYVDANNVDFELSPTSNVEYLRAATGVGIGWTASSTAAALLDTGLSRDAAAVVDVGNGTAANTTGKIKASGLISVGTKFTTNNGCSDSATAGGATAGTFTVGSTSCTEVVTMGDSATSPNGWSCAVVDITTLADVTNPHQTTSNTTTATFVTGTVVSGDKIQFSCIGY